MIVNSPSDASGDPERLSVACSTVGELDRAVSQCRACPRLVQWREEVARTKRASFREWNYWGRPVPGFGPADADIAVVGLAPAAHGANRTGRMFTGDRSGDVLFAALHAVGLASQPTSTAPGDGLALSRVRITAPVRCAPPENKPTTAERDRCRPWLARELELLRPTLRTIVVLGHFGWQALLPVLSQAGWMVPRPAPTFRHGVEYELLRTPAPVAQLMPIQPSDIRATASEPSRLAILGCYHPSQQNTFTGRLTPSMLEAVLRRAAERGQRVPDA